MAVTYSDIKSEVQAIVQDASFADTGANVARILQYANDIQSDICIFNEIPGHLTTESITLVSTAYQMSLPSNFLKPSRSTNVYVDGQNRFTTQTTREYINWKDPDHDETTTSTQGPSFVAIDGTSLYYWPMWAGEIYIQDYYRRPIPMTEAASAADIITEGPAADRIVQEIIVNGVVSKIYRLWLDEAELANAHMKAMTDAIGKLNRLLSNYNNRGDRNMGGAY